MAVGTSEQQHTSVDRAVSVRAAWIGRAWIWLIPILILAATIRLWNLPNQPVLYFDSGVYLGEGVFVASVAERAAAAVFASDPPGVIERVAQATQNGTEAHPPDIAKPGQAVLIGAAMLLLGKTALAGTLLSALAGIGSVAVTFAFGLRGWGTRVAVAAATLLAVSGQALVYSREALVESDGMFFAACAALVYVRAPGWRGLFGAGVLWALAFSTNNRIVYIPAVVLIAELCRWTGWRSLVGRTIAMAAGFGLPLAVIEVGYLAARGIGRMAGAQTTWLDYVQQMATFYRMNAPDRWRPDEWPTYFVDLALMDGLAVLGLFVLGIVLLARRVRSRGQADVLLLASLLVPLALYSVYSTGEVRMRHFSLALPWVMLTAAVALDWLAVFARRHAAAALGVATAALCVLAVPRVVALDSAPNAMPAAVASIGDGRAAGTNGPVLAFYLGEQRSNARLREAFVNVPADLDALSATYPTLVVDMQAYLFPGELTERYERAAPEFSAPHGDDAWYLADLLEHDGVVWGGWGPLLANWDAHRAAATQLRVIRLAELLR